MILDEAIAAYDSQAERLAQQTGKTWACDSIISNQKSELDALRTRNDYLEDYKLQAEKQWLDMDFTISEGLRQQHALTDALKKAKGCIVQFKSCHHLGIHSCGCPPVCDDALDTINKLLPTL